MYLQRLGKVEPKLNTEWTPFSWFEPRTFKLQSSSSTLLTTPPCRQWVVLQSQVNHDCRHWPSYGRIAFNVMYISTIPCSTAKYYLPDPDVAKVILFSVWKRYWIPALHSSIIYREGNHSAHEEFNFRLASLLNIFEVKISQNPASLVAHQIARNRWDWKK